MKSETFAAQLYDMLVESKAEAMREGRQFARADALAVMEAELSKYDIRPRQERPEEPESASEELGLSSPRSAPPAVEAIYAAFPRKVGKKDALRAIRAALRSCPADRLLERTQVFAAAVARWPQSERNYCPHPATWYNRGSFEDDPGQWVRGRGGWEVASPYEARANGHSLPEPAGWRAFVRENFINDAAADRPWSQFDVTAQRHIMAEMGRR